MSKRVTVALRIAVSALLIYLLSLKISFVEVGDLFKVYSIWTLLFALVLYLIAIFVSAFRWWVLLPEFRLRKIIRFTFVGLFYSFVLPGQITGELAKACRFTSDSKTGGGKVASSILIDKVIGLLGVVLLTIVGLVFSEIPDQRFDYFSLVIGFTILLFFIFIFFLKGSSIIMLWSLGQKVKNWIPILEPLSSFVQTMFENGKKYSKKHRALFKNFFLGIIFQLLAVMITYVLAINQGVSIHFIEWFWIFGLVSIVAILPITFAGIGVREGMFAYFLMQFGVELEVAVLLSLTVLLLQVVGALVGGVLELISFFKKCKNDV